MRGRSERTSTRATSMAWRTPFPPSRMPASIELSIKLVVCLEGAPGPRTRPDTTEARRLRQSSASAARWRAPLHRRRRRRGRPAPGPVPRAARAGRRRLDPLSGRACGRPGREPPRLGLAHPTGRRVAGHRVRDAALPAPRHQPHLPALPQVPGGGRGEGDTRRAARKDSRTGGGRALRTRPGRVHRDAHRAQRGRAQGGQGLRPGHRRRPR